MLAPRKPSGALMAISMRRAGSTAFTTPVISMRWLLLFRSFKPAHPLLDLIPQNNQAVIYEMPVKWMSSDPSENPLVELGTFDKVIFERLDELAAAGINCIELLPIQDTPQTLNWGYGTRFYFAPDYDIGSPVDARLFVKFCHRKGIRVILDVVMNMVAPQCPLANFAEPWFHEP